MTAVGSNVLVSDLGYAAYLLDGQTGDILSTLLPPSGYPPHEFGWTVGFLGNDLFVADTMAQVGPDRVGAVHQYEGFVPTSTGDYDSDGDVDGFDFLTWQRGFGSVYDSSDLADWEAKLRWGQRATGFQRNIRT